MPITKEAFAAAVAIATVGLGMAMSASNSGQDAMFSEAQAYERFMGRWSRELAPQFVRFAAVRDGDTLSIRGRGREVPNSNTGCGLPAEG
jgi:hypothetical protein